MYAQTPVAQNGTIDLTTYDFTKNVVGLKGDWEIYWKKFYYPTDFASSKIQPDKFIRLPSGWSDSVIDGKKLPGQGYATHRLHIKLPPDTYGIFGIKVNHMTNAYRLWVNGKLLLSDGKPGKSKQESIPHNYPQANYFKINGDKTLEIIVHISNFHHRSGGNWEVVYFGSAKEIERFGKVELGKDLFLIGSIFIMSIYHLGLFLIRTKDKSTLFFGLFGLLVSLRIFIRGEHVITMVFPELTYLTYNRLMYIDFMLMPPIFLHFLKNIYPGLSWSIFSRLVSIISSGFILIVLFTDTTFFTYIVHFFYLVIIISGIYTIMILFKAYIKKEEAAKLFLYGFIIFFATVINDILKDSTPYQSKFLLPFGLLFFIFIQSVVLSIRFLKAFHKTEILSDELVLLNNELESKVAIRTIELQKQKESAVHANRIKDKLIMTISHDLKSPIQGVFNLMEVMSLPEKKHSSEDTQRYINMSRETLKNSLEMIRQILNLDKITEGNLEIRKELIELQPLLIQLKKEAEPQLILKNMEMKIQVSNEDLIRADVEFFPQVIRNVISNAMKHSPENSSIQIKGKQEENGYTIEVIDEGPGMTDKKLRSIENIKKIDLQNEKSKVYNKSYSGVGLIICKYILDLHQGSISFESMKKKGLKVSVYLPD